ncbi:MAG: DUF2202 domain-containing protein [Anaerolineaceae bacterium]|nr:DUF2202 domain-containing protein [Anaerolineaceae bacterium]
MNTNRKTIFGLLAATIILTIGLMACVPASPVSADASLPVADRGGRGGNGNPTGTGDPLGSGMGAGSTTTNPMGELRGSGTGSERMGGQRGSGNGQLQSGAALTPLTDAEQDALQRAILEEYGALNLYQSVIAKFGDVVPFNSIVLAEQQHINALVRQAEKYGVEVPANPGLTTTPAFETITQACQAGVDAEIADAKLYDELKLVTTHEDVLRVYSNLQAASLNNHLVQFEACN